MRREGHICYNADRSFFCGQNMFRGWNNDTMSSLQTSKVKTLDKAQVKMAPRYIRATELPRKRLLKPYLPTLRILSQHKLKHVLLRGDLNHHFWLILPSFCQENSIVIHWKRKRFTVSKAIKLSPRTQLLKKTAWLPHLISNKGRLLQMITRI